jgi:hypothetical protein
MKFFGAWIICQMIINILGFLFVNFMSVEDQYEHNFAVYYCIYSTLILNILTIYVYFNKDEMEHKPLYKLTSHFDYKKICILVLLFLWLIPMIMVIVYMKHINYVLGIWSIITVLYFTIKTIHEWKTKEDDINNRIITSQYKV